MGGRHHLAHAIRLPALLSRHYSGRGRRGLDPLWHIVYCRRRAADHPGRSFGQHHGFSEDLHALPYGGGRFAHRFCARACQGGDRLWCDRLCHRRDFPDQSRAGCRPGATLGRDDGHGAYHHHAGQDSGGGAPQGDQQSMDRAASSPIRTAARPWHFDCHRLGGLRLFADCPAESAAATEHRRMAFGQCKKGEHG